MVALFRDSKASSHLMSYLSIPSPFSIRIVIGVAILLKYFMNLRKNWRSPIKLLTFVYVFGVGQFCNTSTFFELNFIPPLPTIIPRKEISDFINSHFFGDTYNLCYSKRKKLC